MYGNAPHLSYNKSVKDEIMNIQNSFKQGLEDSIPIAVGYFSVSITFGMLAAANNVPVWVAVVISLTCLTSAGQYGGMALIIEGAPLMEVALSQLIINSRYLLMSLSLTQKIDKKLSTWQRALISFGITDEIFAMASSKEGKIGARYMAGLIIPPVIGWTLGTLTGGIATSLMPRALQNALGIAIYGMFLAIIIPPAKKSHPIRIVLCIAILCSCIITIIKPWVEISSGFAIIICTLIAAGLGAYFFPVKEDNNE